MALSAAAVKRFLDSRHVAYKSHALAPFASLAEAAMLLNVAPACVVQAVPMSDRLGLLIAVIASDRRIDFAKLSRLLGRTVEPASSAQVIKQFPDCDVTALPPIGAAYGVRVILDDALANVDRLYFSAGDGSTVIETRSLFFFQLQAGAALCHDFTESAANTGAAAAQSATRTNASDVIAELARVDQLPPMPALAQEILALAAQPHADTRVLSGIIAKDPSLAAQVMRYARSPYFAYRGRVDTLTDAISRVLGFDMVMHLALGLATARPFRIQRSGPLGLDAFWRHSVYSASLAQALCANIPPPKRPRVGVAYLAGLLHNFGHLLMGHLFKREFAQINEWLVANPESNVRSAECKALAISHDQLGSTLLERWQLPPEIIVAAREHHDPDYRGPYREYALLTCLVDRVLKNHGMGDADSTELPADILGYFELSEVDILVTVNRVLEACDGLNTMAQQLAA